MMSTEVASHRFLPAHRDTKKRSKEMRIRDGFECEKEHCRMEGPPTRPAAAGKTVHPPTLTNTMTTIAASFRRLTFRGNRAAPAAGSLDDLCVTATIEAKVPGFADFVLIDTGLATGSAVVWNAALGRYVSGAVQRGEILRITGGAAATTLGFVHSTGTCPTLKLPVSGTGYFNAGISVTRNTTVKHITLRVSSSTNARDVYTSQKSAPIVSARQL